MIRQLQSEVAAWQRDLWPNYTDPARKALKFTEEAGEVAGAVIKMEGGFKDIDDLRGELGDAVISLVALADAVGVDLETTIADRWAQVRARTYGQSRQDGRHDAAPS
ncbi:MAG: MazG nucleotide pyrophosphohydrolase domain-containing protein [Acidimicrobiales bacterium]